MSVKSGKVTFGSTGSLMIYVEVNAVDVDFYAGSRDGTVETNGMLAVGHADEGKQFCHTIKDGKSETSQTKCMVAYNAAGTKVLEFNVSGGWGTPFLTFNVTLANANYPFELVART